MSGRAVHATLTSNVVYLATLDQAYALVKVVYRSATAAVGDEIYFTTDGSVPTVGGSNTHVVACVQGQTTQVAVPVDGQSQSTGGLAVSTTVQLICSVAAAFSVEGVE